MEKDQYSDIVSKLNSANTQELEAIAEDIEGFPCGRDGFIWRHWITNAIDCGSFDTVKWMLSKGVELNFTDDEGFSSLHSAIARNLPNKYEILEALIKAGADVNAHGRNDETPLHFAAGMEDIKAIEMLLKAGADRTIKTRIDNYATPEEEARMSGRHEAADLIANFGKKNNRKWSP